MSENETATQSVERHITDHVVDGQQNAVDICVLDKPGQGNACHDYLIKYRGGGNGVHFQNGPIGEVGANGISGEALLAILIDRLRGFQSGEFACESNAAALDACQDALDAMKKRTADRIARGVEGKHIK